MDEDFFTEQGATTAISSQPVSMPLDEFGQQNPINQQDDQFEFQQPESTYQAMDQPFSIPSPQQNEQIIRMREEEEKIQAQLREKANLEYEQKNKRKEEARKQLEEFLEQKDEEKLQRRKDNIEKEAKLKQEYVKINEQAGWKKVAMNVPLKQGEHPGKKPINRMRESIINKRNDEDHL